MTLKECLLINNKCYKANNPINKVTGIVVHDTGAPNKYLKRYVQPDKSQSYYQEVLTDLGVNANGNDWNKDNERYACVHGFIGLNAAGQVETYKTLPYDICCWGVGNGIKGSYNYNPTARIQFEICADSYDDEDYFNKVMKEAQEYCAYLCKQFNLTSDDICSHHESYVQGYGGNHGDCDGWLSKFGKDMNWFRNEVKKLLNNSNEVNDMTNEELDALVSKKVKEELANTVKQEKVYHYYSELPDWARPTIEAMHKNGVFSGDGPNDMNLPEEMMRMLVILHSNGVLKTEK